MDQNIRALREGMARSPGGVVSKARGAEGRLVVRYVDDGNARFCEPVADRRPGMKDKIGDNADGVDLELTERRVMEEQTAGDLPQMHREERWREVSPQPLSQVHGKGRRSPDVDLSPWLKKRGEEA